MQMRLSIFTFICLIISTNLNATKLVTYNYRGEDRLGAWLDGEVIDLNRAYKLFLKDNGKPRAQARADAFVPPHMVEFLSGEKDSLQAAMEAFQFIKELILQGERAILIRDGILFPESEFRLRAPVPEPPNLLAIGGNYRAHILEGDGKIPEYPTVFSKHGLIIGTQEPILIPEAVKEPDYEAELAFVIGRRARRVKKKEALDYVAGYMVFNDVSARVFQDRVSQWTLGKSADTFSVMGPFLVLKDEIPDPQKLKIIAKIGEKVVQNSNTEDMIFSVADIVAYISQIMTLEPGTVIATGTPSGVGAARKRFLLPNDVVTVEIEDLGTLVNTVIKETYQ